MNGLHVIDRFMEAFIRYIDSGFGLLGPDVGFLTTVLIGIDVTLAGLFWAMGGENDVLGRFIKKILFVGVFALFLNSFSRLSDIVFRSFAQAGLTAGGGQLTSADLLRPGKLAATGFDAAWPLVDQANRMAGITTFFDNFLAILVLLIAWLLVVVAFFILAVQLFVTVIEFKLTSLAGFVLVPFALWNRTSFLAERVLGNVVSSGVKVMMLAVIVGIGSGFFEDFVAALGGGEPDLAAAMSLVLASLTLLGLGIFGPGIASGLVSGAPQLGAGAAAGTMIGAAGTVTMGAGAASGAARMMAGGALSAVRAGTAMGSAVSTAADLGRSSGGTALGGVVEAARGATRRMVGNALGIGDAATRGRAAATLAHAGAAPTPGEGVGRGHEEVPAWARRMRAQQDARHHRHVAVATLKDGDRGGASVTPDIKEEGR